MSVSARSRLRGLCLIAAIFALFVAAPVAHAAPQYGGPPTPNTGTYLALGDSLAFGYQGYKVATCQFTGCTNPDGQFSTGYVDFFANSFSSAYPGVKTVNLGCPGESSVTFLNSTNSTTGCQGLFVYPFAIHSNHPGQTQLQAAVQVLRERGKRVNPITIDIGANDVNGLVASCGGADALPGSLATCIQPGWAATTATIQRNLDTVLSTLRAEGGKTKEIIVVGIYNPLYIAVLGNPATAASVAAAAQTDVLANQLNTLERQTAAKYNAKFVDPMPTFNPSNGANPPLEAGTICTLTLMCDDRTTATGLPSPPNPSTIPGPDGKPDGDIHASDAGYAALGGLIKTASGY